MRLRRIALAPRQDQVAILRQIIGHVDGEPVFVICGAEGEGSGDGDGGNKDGDADTGGSGSSGTGDDDDEDDDGDEGDTPPKGTKDVKAWYENKKLRDEAARRRVKAREEKERADKLQAELDAVKQKDMSELQKAQAAAAKAEKANEELQSRVEGMQVELAFLKMPRDKHDWHDPGAALTLLMAEHRDTLTLEDDGTVTGLDEAVKALAKKHKYLLKVATAGNGNGKTGGDVGTGDQGKGGNQGEAAVKRFRF